ncbi:MAG: hypothetical protein LBK66_07095 [Spirochaetaceae bacterium]|nr:hypothetical protein [Spirochaetaceae bacterium]
MRNDKTGSRVCNRYSRTLRHGVKPALGMSVRSALGCVKTQKIEMTPLYIALLNRTIKKITLYMEATMTFDTGWHVNPLAGGVKTALGMPARSSRKPAQ